MNSPKDIVYNIFATIGLLAGDACSGLRRAMFGPSSEELFKQNYGLMDVPTSYSCNRKHKAKRGYNKKTGRYWIECRRCRERAEGATAHEAEKVWLALKPTSPD